MSWLLLLLATDIYRADRPDGSVVFTDSPTHNGFVLVASDGPIPLPSQVSVRSFPDLDRWDEALVETGKRVGVEPALLKAVVLAESAMNPRALSDKGAMGLMQLMPGTAVRMSVTNPFDARQNVLGGTRYLRILANLFNGDIVLTLAAYNAGEGTVVRSGGMPRNPQIHTYVRNVLRHFYAFRLVEMATARSVREAVDQSQRLDGAPQTQQARPPAPTPSAPTTTPPTPGSARGSAAAPTPPPPSAASTPSPR